MGMKSFISFIIVAFVFMMGCATAPITLEPQRTSAVINASKDRVWPLLVEEVSSRYSIQAIEKESGLITTNVYNVPVFQGNTLSYRRYIFIENPGARFSYEKLRMNMNISVVELEPGKTTININAYYEVYVINQAGQGTTWLAFPSNGSVENEILTNIENKLK